MNALEMEPNRNSTLMTLKTIIRYSLELLVMDFVKARLSKIEQFMSNIQKTLVIRVSLAIYLNCICHEMLWQKKDINLINLKTT